MAETLPLLYSRSHHLDPQANQEPTLLPSRAKRKREAPLEEPCRERPTVAGLAHSQDQLAVLPGSAAWLPCRLSLVPGLSPHAHAQMCEWPWSATFHQELCSLLFLILQVAVAQEQLGSQGEGMGQSWPLPMPAWQKHCQRELWRPVDAVGATGSYSWACA